MPSIEANGEQIFFVDEGEGPSILFIHSLGTTGVLQTNLSILSAASMADFWRFIILNYPLISRAN